MDSALDRTLTRAGTNRLDAALAVVLVLAGLAQTLVSPITDGALGIVYVLGSLLPLAWRRTRPVESALASSAFWLIPLDGYPLFGFVAVILQFYALGCYASPRWAVVLTAAWASAASVVGTLLGPEPPVSSVGGVLAVVAPVLVGQVVARLRDQNARLARLTDELRDERRRAEESAVGAERARIAQELHDVVGHEVTLIAIQAEAAQAALRLDPSRAAAPVETIRQTAHRTLTEIRGVLGVLSPDGDAGHEDIRELSRRAAAAGIAHTLTVVGEPWNDQSPATAAVERVVRECLTNAGRHAAGNEAALTVTWTGDEVTVESANAAAAPTDPLPGRGLTGMRHRAELLGGSFEARVRDGRFVVRVVVPDGAR
ncbi:sensor histidine kinase [Cellulomonas sp. URHD0024]|uniref:sensor histidine kinase n=1 Tax=Cellulomonas sp. URHD0024 TaxID=1302620 RepID=UPI0004136212|nr:histidine kinase [Cellulomonas sp. URHD0024]